MTEPRDTTPYTENTEPSAGDGKPVEPFTDPGQDPEHRARGRHAGGNLSDLGEPAPFTDPAAGQRAARNAAEEEDDPPDSGMDALIDEVDQRTSGLVGKLRNKFTSGREHTRSE